MEHELAAIREGEDFDRARVEAWLREHVPDLDDSPMEMLQFPGGHANLTYLARFGERELVLRRPPLGPVAPSSHDMAREYKVLSRLHERFAPAPRAFALCEDTGVMGAIFVVMERRCGIVVRGVFPEAFENLPAARRRMGDALIDTMADFHDVDFAAIGLADLGKPDGFVERQVSGWRRRWDRAKEADLAIFDEVHEWLQKQLPASPGASLVHNDLKFDNVMFAPDDPGRIVAVLDWDMTTLGDPLIDLGTLLGYWVQADDPPERGATVAVTAQEGFPTRAEIAARYSERRGIDVRTIAWYEVFALWKTAVVLQQIYIRFVRGQTRDDRFQAMGPRIPQLIRLAASTAARG